jgi:hypothetical protein
MKKRLRFERFSFGHRALGFALACIGAAILVNEQGAYTLAWGAGLALTGGFLTLVRGGNVIDFEAKEVIAYLGLLWPWSRERRPFSSLRVVSIEGRAVGRSKLGGVGRYEFPIELRGEGPDVRLCEPRVYAKARRLAMELAHRMKLALSDHGVERESGFTDEPLRDRLLRTGAIPGREVVVESDPYRNVIASRVAPEPPADTVITVEDREQATRIEVPGAFRISTALILAQLLGLFAAAPAFLFSTGFSDGRSFAVAWAMVLGPFVLLFLAIGLRGATARWRVLVDAKAVVVEKRTWLFGRRWVFPLGQLDDVHTASGAEPRYHDLVNVLNHKRSTPFVVVRSTERAVPVGIGRSPEELDWLVARIQHAIARHSTGTRAQV